MNLGEIQNQIKKFLGLTVDKIEVIKEKGLNYVYKIYVDNKQYILKKYRKEIDFSNTNSLINYLQSKSIKTIQPLQEFKYNGYIYMLYQYIEGKHIDVYNNLQIDEITNLLNVLVNNKIHNGNETILDKCNLYFEHLLNLDNYENKKIVKLLYGVYNSLKIDVNDFILVHGDLSNVNLLWNDEINVIDFDESILAPKEYEICSCIIKNCFSDGKFNINQAKRIFNSLKNKTNIDYNTFRNSWSLYIIKVIIEKLYYASKSDNKNVNVIRSSDHWGYWLNLMFNEDIISNLFDYHKIDLIHSLFNSKIINDSYKGQVRIIGDNGKKYIEKIEYIKDYCASINEYNLINMLYNFGINGLEFYNLEKKDNGILKCFSYCDGINKNNLSENDIKRIIQTVYKMHSFLKEYGNKFLKNEKGNICEKLNWCFECLKDTKHIDLVSKLLYDKTFIESLNAEEDVIIHDDLHRDNFIFNNQGDITILDFNGLKKYPESLQLASLIVNLLLLYDDNRIDIVINNWPEKIEDVKLHKLIIFRILKGLAFYYKYLINLNNLAYDNKAKNLEKSLKFMLQYKMEE